MSKRLPTILAYSALAVSLVFGFMVTTARSGEVATTTIQISITDR